MYKRGKLLSRDLIVGYVHFVTMFLFSFYYKIMRDTAFQSRLGFWAHPVHGSLGPGVCP